MFYGKTFGFSGLFPILQKISETTEFIEIKKRRGEVVEEISENNVKSLSYVFAQKVRSFVKRYKKNEVMS